MSRSGFHGLVYYISIAESIVRKVLLVTTFLVPMVKIVRNLVDRAFDENQLRRLDTPLTPMAGTKLSSERSLSNRRHKTSRSQSDSKSDKEHCRPHRHRRSFSCQNLPDQSRSRSFCSGTDSMSDKSGSRQNRQHRKAGENALIAVRVRRRSR